MTSFNQLNIKQYDWLIFIATIPKGEFEKTLFRRSTLYSWKGESVTSITHTIPLVDEELSLIGGGHSLDTQ